jgi:Na+/melibiose symporter-like transporter
MIWILTLINKKDMILAIIIFTLLLVIAIIFSLFCYLHYHSQINELKRQKGREFEERILIALLSNPERYKYISELVESGRISQEEANKKNIHKAFKIAETFKRYPFESMQKSRQNPELKKKII